MWRSHFYLFRWKGWSGYFWFWCCFFAGSLLWRRAVVFSRFLSWNKIGLLGWKGWDRFGTPLWNVLFSCQRFGFGLNKKWNTDGEILKVGVPLETVFGRGLPLVVVEGLEDVTVELVLAVGPVINKSVVWFVREPGFINGYWDLDSVVNSLGWLPKCTLDSGWSTFWVLSRGLLP